MSNYTSQRERFQGRRRGQKRRTSIGWVIGILVVAGMLGLLVWNAVRPPYGEEVASMGGGHVPTGNDPGQYNSDPPTSGPHYDATLPPGFYEESDLADLGPYPWGHAVHNLEHGYIVFWYNCDLLSVEECDQLKTQIREYMENSPVPKLIAFPWKSIDIPLVLTSWGYRLEMPTFDARQASRFINANRMRAPEPEGQ